MYELIGKIAEARMDMFTGRAFLVFEIDQKQTAKECFDNLHHCEKVAIKVDRYRKKRSLNANAYCWKLLTEIANKVRASKDEVYLEMLKRYGQRDLISVQAHIPISEYIKYCEEAGETTLNGKQFKHYYVYKGSSEFDTHEMSIFIDGVVSEAKALGIQTETPDQIAKMKALWAV